MPLVSDAPSPPDEYIASLPDDRRATVAAVRDVVRAHLPPGYQEGILYGMIGRVSSRVTRTAGNAE